MALSFKKKVDEQLDLFFSKRDNEFGQILAKIVEDLLLAARETGIARASINYKKNKDWVQLLEEWGLRNDCQVRVSNLNLLNSDTQAEIQRKVDAQTIDIVYLNTRKR